MKTVFALALLTLAATASAGEPQALRFYGYAYDLQTNRYLYTEVHDARVDGERWLGGTITYYAADGALIGRKTLDFANDPCIPIYRLDLVAHGYAEGITDNRDAVAMIKRAEADQPEQSKRLDKNPSMAADSGFHSYIRAHMPQILKGDTVPLTLAVAGELDTFKFRIRRAADTRFEDKPAVHLRVELDSFLRLMADPLELTYEPGTGKLLEYRGISNIHDPVTGKPYNTRVAYYSQPPPDAPKNLPPLNPPLKL